MIARERSGTGKCDSDGIWLLVSLPNTQKHLRFPNPLMGHPILQRFIGGGRGYYILSWISVTCIQRLTNRQTFFLFFLSLVVQLSVKFRVQAATGKSSEGSLLQGLFKARHEILCTWRGGTSVGWNCCSVELRKLRRKIQDKEEKEKFFSFLLIFLK